MWNRIKNRSVVATSYDLALLASECERRAGEAPAGRRDAELAKLCRAARAAIEGMARIDHEKRRAIDEVKRMDRVLDAAEAAARARWQSAREILVARFGADSAELAGFGLPRRRVGARRG